MFKRKRFQATRTLRRGRQKSNEKRARGKTRVAVAEVSSSRPTTGALFVSVCFCFVSDAFLALDRDMPQCL